MGRSSNKKKGRAAKSGNPNVTKSSEHLEKRETRASRSKTSDEAQKSECPEQQNETDMSTMLSKVLQKHNISGVNMQDQTAVILALLTVIDLKSECCHKSGDPEVTCEKEEETCGGREVEGEKGDSEIRCEKKEETRGGWKEVEGRGSAEVRKGLAGLEGRIRENEDFSDFCHQRSLKGNILLCSPSDPEKNLVTLIKSPEECENEGMSYTDHILDLVKQHYEVEIPIQDIVAIHPTKKSGHCILKIWNRRMNSAYQKLCESIKRGGKSGRLRREAQGGGRGESQNNGVVNTQQNQGRSNFWATFQMTRRRSELISTLKVLKKEKKIATFSSNENGDIWVKLNHQQKKIQITYDWRVQGSRTDTALELKARIS